jgi:hypothetical protein
LHLSAALPPPANLISMRLREAPTAVPDSSCVGSSLPSGTPAVAASATVFPVLDKDCTNEKKSTVADSYSVGSPLPPAILLDRSHLTLSAAWAETSFYKKDERESSTAWRRVACFGGSAAARQHSNKVARSAHRVPDIHCFGSLAAVRHTSGSAASNGRQSRRNANRERANRISRKPQKTNARDHV